MTRLEPGESREWEYRGMECRVTKNDLGHWCGYVKTALQGFTNEHLFDVEGHEHQRLIDVHGGLSYGPDEAGWAGFDCGHARDVNLNEDGEIWGTMYDGAGAEPVPLRQHDGDIEAAEKADDVNVWRIKDVKEETERLADQLILLERFMRAADVE